MKINRFEVIDRCLYWRSKSLLVIGDLHLGYENMLHEQGWSFPKRQMKETFDLLEKIINRVRKKGKLNRVLLLGDVKHYFAGVLQEEFRDFKRLLDFFQQKGIREIVIVKGNHDNILKPVIDRWQADVRLVDSWQEDDVLFIHGDKYSLKKIGLDQYKNHLVVKGHFHPAIKLRDDVKVEMYKCFVYNKKELVVPSFFPLVEGQDIREQGLNGRIYVVGDKVYDFGDFNA
ncbi:MAG: metallophosphoesterase [Candidatus Nanoarchaeia archaeon]